MELFTSGRQTHGLQNSGLHPTVMCLYVIRPSLENLHFKHSTLCICYISITIFYDHLWKGLVVVVVVVKLLPCDQEVMGSSPENSLLQKCREMLRTKDPSGRTLPRTLRKRELRAPGCSFFGVFQSKK
jgi:hypothetical protein